MFIKSVIIAVGGVLTLVKSDCPDFNFSLNIFYLNFMTYIHIYIYTHYKRIRTEA